ncbi:transposase [Bradyrhizobium sp. 2S1]|uniref:transposase n=1 Tax=Bradyrhizobium sp. 2S1 TaxID=1404429 RepID=UPI001CD102D2|nr:transposase [Bradyrhizobium sp. 2S1]
MNAGECIRRLFFVIFAPDSRQESSPLSGRKSTQATVRICGASSKIIAAHSKRRRRVEFLDFMNSVTAAFPNRKLHVILDNLNTHKKNEHWLKAHPNVQFHFTPTSASWLNQVEVWFSILQGQSLSGTSFTSLTQLQEHIDAYVNAYNDRAEPFVWTKKKVRQRRFKGRRITQL